MFIYLGVFLFVALFGFIYEQFSHGVYSFFMAFAFLFPMTLGFLPYIIFYFFGKGSYPSVLTSDLYNAGVATITVASIFKGVLDIYGTTRDVHLYILSITGLILLIAGVVSHIVSLVKKGK
ncbi:MAG: hypothetical protein MJ238_05980 [Bacilli bacterium]|nr:hypothetical protein [Bacilli bacterium]